MSLKQIAAEKYDELRVARLYGRNAQLSVMPQQQPRNRCATHRS